jgi:hypothetical protein
MADGVALLAAFKKKEDCRLHMVLCKADSASIFIIMWPLNLIPILSASVDMAQLESELPDAPIAHGNVVKRVALKRWLCRLRSQSMRPVNTDRMPRCKTIFQLLPLQKATPTADTGIPCLHCILLSLLASSIH